MVMLTKLVRPQRQRHDVNTQKNQHADRRGRKKKKHEATCLLMDRHGGEEGAGMEGTVVGTGQLWSCWVLYTVSPEEIWVSLLLEPHSFRVIWPERI